MINKINLSLLLLLPFSLIFSAFIADFTTIILSLSFLYYVIKNNEYKYLNYKVFFILIIWSIYLIFSSLNSKDIFFSFQSSLFYFRFVIFAFAINYFLSKNQNLLKLFFVSLFLSFILLIFDSFFQLYFNYNLFGYRLVTENLYGYRISSFFKDEYILGSFLSRLSPLLMGLILIFWKFDTLKSVFFILFFLLIDLAILISGERSAFLYSIIFCCFFIFFSKKIFLLVMIKNILLLTGFISILISFPEVNKRFLEYTTFQLDNLESHEIIENQKNISSNITLNTESEDLIKSKNFSNFISKSKFFLIDKIAFTVQHKMIYQNAIKISEDYFFLGIGPKMFRKICINEKYISQSEIDKSINGCQSHPHNTYVQVLTETGIIGFIFVISIFTYVCYKIIFLFFRKFRGYFNYNDSLLCFYICVFITLWPIVPTGNFFHNWLNIIYFLPIAFILNISTKSNDIIDSTI